MFRHALLLLLAACGGSEPAAAPAPAPAPTEAAPAPAPAAAPAADAPARGDDSDRKSKNGEVTLKLGDAKVRITYGRPEARGRTVWGELVPYGKVWRTGADEATVLTATAPFKLGDTEVPAGSYALFTVPGEKEWTVLLNSVAAQWGSYEYDASKDVAKATTTPETGEATEAFTIDKEGGTLYLKWAEVKVPVPLAPAG